MSQETVLELRRQIAQLETHNDLLLSQLMHVDELLLRFGFPKGTSSLVEALHDMVGLVEEEDSPSEGLFGEERFFMDDPGL